MIVFRTVRWKNLLSTGKAWTEIKLDGEQNTLIIGENGAGKSTILDALCFALFGKAFRDINKPNLINSINSKDCVVEVTFSTNNKNYRIVRGIKPSIFEIYQDGQLIQQLAAARDYQELLEKTILKFNYKSFTQIVVLGSASFTPFMQLTAQDRRVVIEDLLDIQIFSVMNTIVKNRLDANKEKITEKKYQLDLQTQKRTMLLKHIEQLKKNNQERINQIRKEISDNEKSLATIKKENEKITEKIRNLQSFVQNMLDQESKVNKYVKLGFQIEANLDKVCKDISFLHDTNNCPTCQQNIADAYKNEKIKKLSDRKQELKSGLSKLEEKLNEEKKVLSEIQSHQSEIQSLNIKLASNNSTIEQINRNNVAFQRQIKELTVTNSNTNNDELELKSTDELIESINVELQTLSEEKSYLEVSGTLLKDSGIKTKIIKQYLPIINKLVNKYLSALDFFVNFNLDESFKETIKSRHRDDFTYNNFSEGEKQRIDMALMLTWRAVAKLKNSANTNLLILDEVFDSSLDTSGTEYLMNILHMLEGVNLFVISHKGDILQDKFSNVIRFGKVGNFSTIIN